MAGAPSSPSRGWAYWATVCALLNLATVGAVIALMRWPRPGAMTIELPEATSLAGFPVYVSGAVRRPGVYEVQTGALVADAVELAGGPRDDADLAALNMAAALRPRDHVHVPTVGGLSMSSPSGQGTTDAPCVDINAADAQKLESLPGIGPALAKRIIEYRQTHGPFGTPEEVMNVDGIGQKTFERIQPFVCVR